MAGEKKSTECDVSGSTFGQFKARMSTISSIPTDELQIKVGEPPVAVSYPDDTPLADTIICDKSVITVAWKPTHPEEPSSKAAYACNSALPDPDVKNDQELATADISVPLAGGGGYLVRRTVPMDNSCLFSSLAGSLGQSGLSSQNLRAIASQMIMNNSDTYNEAVLERPVPEYCQWISDPVNWGGAIEIAVLGETFRTEVCSVDIRTRRMQRFGEEKYPQRVFLLYSGVHYDYVAFRNSPADPPEFDQTAFSTRASDAPAILDAAIELAAQVYNQTHSE
ncbi:ubiquitin-specific protease otu1 [Coemansia sp. RSA 552]|nr:ubiquitin-specific protease otu1 [Coemansia sp. RSA 552]